MPRFALHTEAGLGYSLFRLSAHQKSQSENPHGPRQGSGTLGPRCSTNTFLQAPKHQSQNRHPRSALCLAFPGSQHCAAHCFTSSPPGFDLLRCFTVPISCVRTKVLELWVQILLQYLEKKKRQYLSFFLYLVPNLFSENCCYNTQYAYGDRLMNQ